MNRVYKEQRVLGIDIGFETTGMCYSSYPINKPLIYRLETGDKRTKWPGYKKFVSEFFCNEVNIPNIINSDLIIIEKPFNVPGHGKVLIELLGIFKREFVLWNKSFVEVPQKTLKKFATDNGNAKKSEMVKRALKEYQVEAETEDEIDAFWASLLGHCILQPEKFSKARQESIKKLVILR